MLTNFCLPLALSSAARAALRAKLCCALAVLACVSMPTMGQSTSTISVPQIIPGGYQVIYAPLAGLKEFSTWQLALVNRSSGLMPATITVYSAEGTPFAPKKVILEGNESRILNLRAITPGVSEDEGVGGVAVSFTGQSMGIGAQVTISGYHGFGNVDAPVFPDMMYKSNTADAIWWEPQGARSYLVLANSSAETLKATYGYGAGKEHEVQIGPHATIIREVPRDDDFGEHSARISSVHVGADGMPGTLRVTGYTVSAESGFVNTIRSFDPASSSEPAIYSNGLHFSAGTNHLVVKNVSNHPLRISATIFPLRTTNSPGIVLIPFKTLGAGATGELDLSGIQDFTSLDGAAIKVESTGGNASVIASLTNQDRENRIVRAPPFKDIGDYSVLTGAYPWRLDGHFDSRIFITNVGKVKAAIGAKIIPLTGPEYFIDTQYLEVGETTVFDLRKIRDEQIADAKGVKLSKKAEIGQFKWSTIFGDGTQRLIGRNEVTDRSSGISASFSCPSCNCPASTSAAALNPNSAAVYVDGTFTGFVATGTTSDTCSGGLNYFTITPPSWSINSSSILSLTSGSPSSTMKGLSLGSSSFYTPFQGIDYAFNGNNGTCFVAAQPQLNPGGTGSVTPRALPTNFSATAGTPLNDGSLSFTYTWQSSSGKLSDIADCQAGETVFYPGNGQQYTWPLPMVSTTNTTFTRYSSAQNSTIVDRNYPPTGYKKPYFNASFNATQRLQWECPNYNNGNFQPFTADIVISRKVFLDTDSKYKYEIDKSGSTNKVSLP